jgi:recombinational DNA repair protein (RecF pathway)
MKKQPSGTTLMRALNLVTQLRGVAPDTERCDVCGRQTELQRVLLIHGRFHCSSCANGAFLKTPKL